MSKSATDIFLIVTYLLLVMAGISLADSPTTKPGGTMLPEDIFNNRSLRRMGFWLIIPNEIEVHDGVKSLTVAKQHMIGEAAQRRDLAIALKHAHENLDALVAQYKQVDAEYNDLLKNPKTLTDNKNATQVTEYNDWIHKNNQLLGQRDELGMDINKQKSDLDELKKHDTKIGDSRMTYINLAIEIGRKAESVQTAYQMLAKDTELASAIDQYNQTTKPEMKLGPSGIFKDDLVFVRTCVKEATNNAIPVTIEDGEPCVQVTLNGKVTKNIIWDSGATEVQLSAATFHELGLTVTDKDPISEATVADGRKVKVAKVLLDSIRIGGFTVNNVECAVLPPDVNGVDLLGDSFQRHFVCQLNQQTGSLQLTPIDSSVTQGAVAGQLAKPITSTPNQNSKDKTGWIDLMKLIDLKRDVVEGDWKSEDGELSSTDQVCRLQIPYFPSQEYDFQYSFIKTDGVHDITAIIVHGDDQVSMTWNNGWLGLDSANGKRPGDEGGMAVRQDFVNGRRYMITIQVRQTNIRCLIDENFVLDAKIKDVVLKSGWHVKDVGALGVATYHTPTAFSSLKVREITGQGKIKLNNP